jgi:hypothetical protein
MRSHMRAFVVSLVLALALSAGIVTVAAAGHVSVLSALPGAAALTHAAGSGGGADRTHPANHGGAVSKAAHTCPRGAHAVHGKCVRAVAKSSDGKK